MVRAIFACDSNHGIGLNGLIPWLCADDFKHFFYHTQDALMVMGRKTYESLPTRVRNRDCLVLTRQTDFKDANSVNDLDSCVRAMLESPRPVYVIGGGQVYNTLLPFTSEIIRTLIPGDYHCDTFFDVPDDWSMMNRYFLPTPVRDSGGNLTIHHGSPIYPEVTHWKRP